MITLTASNDIGDDDIVQTFQLEISNLRGRVVRLGKVLNDILEPHGYPIVVEHIVAEALTLAVTLAAMLKYDGVFTLQIQGDGPVRMVVADVTSDRTIRACAHFDEGLLETLKDHRVADLFGEGTLSFTVDQSGAKDRYQGIVELQGECLSDSVRHYFEQSEQIASAFCLAVEQVGEGWRSGALALQRMPEGHDTLPNDVESISEEHWRRANILMETCKAAELTDPDLHSSALLIRLFHEEGVRVYEPNTVRAECRCSQERVARVIEMMAAEEVADLRDENGDIIVTCEFCSKRYTL